MESQPYYCVSEWHFARIKGKGAYAATIIYTFALHLSKPKKKDPTTPPKFFASIPNLAKFFALDERTVRKAIHALVKLGFFERLAAEPGQTHVYRPVSHREWSAAHPNQCCEKYDAEMPWSDEVQDTLAVELHAISGGRFKTYPNMLKGMRNTGHDAQAIKAHFQAFIVLKKPVGNQWRNGFTGQFIKYLKNQPILCDNQ